MLGATRMDLCEMNASDFNGIATVRDIRQRSKMRPVSSGSTAKVYFWDEVHKLSADAQDAMLKLVEEPPANTYNILATTNPEKLKIALQRRCEPFEMKALSGKEVRLHLKKVAKRIPKDVRKLIAERSEGSLGIALMLADKIIDLEKDDMKEMVEAVVAENNQGIDLCRALMAGKSWKTVAQLLRNMEGDPESIRRMVLGYFNSVMLNNGSKRAYQIMEAFAEPFYNTGKPGLTIACYESLYADG